MKDEARRASTARVLATCLDAALRLMHPMIPFITDKLYGALNETNAPRGIGDQLPIANGVAHAATKSLVADAKSSASIMTAPYPTFTTQTATLINDSAEQAIDRLQQIVVAIRQVRNDNKVDPKKRIPVQIACTDAQLAELSQNREFIESLSQCTLEQVGPAVTEQPGTSKTSAGGTTIYIAGVVDAAAGDKRRGELTKKVAMLRGRLSNESYLSKAPPKLVQETKDELKAAEDELESLGNA